MFTKDELWNMSTEKYYLLKIECFHGYEDFCEDLDHAAVYINKKRYQPTIYIKDAWKVWEHENCT